MPLSGSATIAWYCSAHESPISRTSVPRERVQIGGMLPPWRNELACVWSKCDSRTGRSALARSERDGDPVGRELVVEPALGDREARRRRDRAAGVPELG